MVLAYITLAAVTDEGDSEQLAWAQACVEGDAAAIEELEAGPLAEVRSHLATLGFAALAIDEVIQRVRMKLIAEGGLRAYRGRGPLAIYVRTTAVRLAIGEAKKVRRDVELGEMFAAPNADPELEYMRKLYADHLAAAVRDAWTRIAAHERFLLSLRIYDAMSIDDLARVYQIHRATAARRAASARAAFIEQVRAALRDRLAIGDTTIDSILRIITTSVQLPIDELPHL
jgi:RNA polymerase sigma-70 factor, ECF subfamily